MDVIQNIGKSIADSFSKSVEAYIAVALVGDSCFRILDKAKKTNKIKFVVGVNLPTPVEVLKELRNRYSNYLWLLLIRIPVKVFLVGLVKCLKKPNQSQIIF